MSRYMKFDNKYNFWSIFNSNTGAYMRSGILDPTTIDLENDPFLTTAVDTGVDPFMASFPELIDVGIMGHCIHGKTGLCVKAGIQCYQDGLHVNKPNMSIEDFEKIAKECKHKCYQFALGGAGDPDQHEHFEDILKICRKYHIVPNYTTSGFGLTPELVQLTKECCGAVAVSWYRSDYTIRAIQMFINAGVKTNIHYVVSNNTIDEAIERLKNNSFPEGINAIIFLLHKPIGLGKKSNMINNNEKLKEFFNLIDIGHFDFKIGFDSCFVPGLINNCKNIDLNSVDTCEGGRFSMYITADMKALPCSFDNQSERWAVDLNNHTIQEAWDSDTFNNFREHFNKSCPNCNNRFACMGGCPIVPEIVLCNKTEKDNF